MPFASPLLELRVLAAVEIPGGLALLASDAVGGEPVGDVVTAAFGLAAALVLGHILARIDGRPEEPRPAPPPAGAHSEPARRTIARSAAIGVGVIAVLVAYAVVVGLPTVMAVVALAIGLDALWTSRSLAAWERRHDRRLLHKPRWPPRAAFDRSAYYAAPR